MTQTQDMLPRSEIAGFLEKHAENNFVYFLAGLLGLICIIPLSDWLGSGRVAYTLLLLYLSGTLVLASWTYRVKRGLLLSGLALAAISFVLSLTAAITGSEVLGYSGLVVCIAFWSLGVWVASAHVLSFGPVTVNKIIGSICIYLMVAVIFAFLNMLINRAVPGSFSNLRATGFTEQLSEFIYYSFVTLNTLGYGDISPVGSLARVASILEATFGVFFLAVLVASLVSMHITYRLSRILDQQQAKPPTPKEGAAHSAKQV